MEYVWQRQVLEVVGVPYVGAEGRGARLRVAWAFRVPGAVCESSSREVAAVVVEVSASLSVVVRLSAPPETGREIVVETRGAASVEASRREKRAVVW